MHPSLFADEAVDLALVRAHPNTRWAALPPDVIPLTAAEPDFPVAPEITEAVAARVADGYFLYCSPYGEASLKEAVAQSLRERQGLVCEPAQLVPTLGTAAGMWLAVHSQCRPGDECIILDPVDLLFGMAVDSAGAKRVYCQVDKRTGRIDLEQLRSLVTPRTRLIAL
ncbi:MAG TPA: aminotransferase class I/II-fold pyridoxal phosphate-dependent enzyme, partial [Myxococcaceae bacterium]|nr:aminotransferase class I/II-fold pyridoxal phosphate-dependent enzyme [Myxococcaceae bacterium]